MKKCSLVMKLMLIISFMAQIETKAQTGNGFIRPEFRNAAKTPDDVAKYHRAACIGMYSNNQPVISKYFHNLSSINRAGMKDLMTGHVEHKLGAEAGSFTDADMLFLFKERIQYRKVGRDYWDSHGSGMILKTTGELRFWDPRDSDFYPNREWWVIAYVTLDDGTTVDIFVADCGNPVEDSEPIADTPDEKYDEEYETLIKTTQNKTTTRRNADINISIANNNYNRNERGQGTIDYGYRPAVQSDEQSVRRDRTGDVVKGALIGVGGTLLVQALLRGRNTTNGYNQSDYSYSGYGGSLYKRPQQYQYRQRDTQYGGGHGHGNNNQTYTPPPSRDNNTMLNDEVPVNYGGRNYVSNSTYRYRRGG